MPSIDITSPSHHYPSQTFSSLIRHLIRHVFPTNQPQPLAHSLTHSLTQIPPSPPTTTTNPQNPHKTPKPKPKKENLPRSLLKHAPRLIRNLLVHPPLLGRVDLALAELLLRGVEAWDICLARSPRRRDGGMDGDLGVRRERGRKRGASERGEEGGGRR